MKSLTTKENFIDEEKLLSLLHESKEPDKKTLQRILKKALLLKGLDLAEAAALLNINAQDDLAILYKTALQVKESIYGNRLVFFAPLYVSNHCANNCLYCGFRRDNTELVRVCLTQLQLIDEVKMLLKQGHKRLLMLMGEHHGECSFDYFLESIKTVYGVKDDKGNSIKRINVEIAPLTNTEFALLAEAEIGTYTVFQETYHQETYSKAHPNGKKSDYLWRLTTMDRALANGLHDVGIGALFGLYDFKFETLALLMHAEHLDRTFGVGPHTISVPRIEPADNAPLSQNIPNKVSDDDFKKLIAVLRCSVPYTGIILSTRESAEFRDEVFRIGVSQISAGSRTGPGGYHSSARHSKKAPGQFSVNDTRTISQVLHSVMKSGFSPSFCTACYRTGRVGKDFMDMAKPGLIQQNCLPNSLLTLKEYLLDYADEPTRKMGESVIEREIAKIPNERRKKQTLEYLSRIEQGERDLFC